jgi:copper(I)-binding protein
MHRVNKLRALTSWLAWVACCVVCFASPQALAAQQDGESPLIATDAWIRATPGSDVAAAYLTLRNVSNKPVTLVAVDSSVASMAMIHETKTENGISRMRPHEQLVIPPGKTVKLEPGGLHVMLHGITQPLATGASVPLVLRLANGTSLQIVALVRPLNAQ